MNYGWATSYNFTLSTTGSYDSTDKTITWSDSYCTILQAKGNSQSNVNSSYVSSPRWYSGHLITFTPASGYNITKIIITATESGYNGKTMTVSSGGGTVENTSTTVSTWTGSISNSSPLTLKMGSQCRVSTVNITYEALDSRTAVGTIGDINVSSLPYGDEGTFTVGFTPADGLTASDYTVAWTEMSEDQLTLLEDGTYEAGTTKGEVEVEVTVTPKDAVTYKPVSKIFNVTVYDPDAGDGSESRPFSVAEAIDNTPATGTSSAYYIKGYVSSFYGSSVMDDDTYYRYYISDDDGTTNELLVYSGKNIGNVAFASADDIKVGDLLVIYGGLTTYSSTKEVAANNYIVSINGKKLPGIAYETTSYNTLPANTTFVTPVLTNPNSLAVTYSTSDAEVANVNTTTGAVTIGTKEGTATVTATFAGNSSFFAGTATYTITTARAEANISFEETSVTLTKGDEFESPAFNNPNALEGIVFTSSYEGVATVSSKGVISLGGNTGTAVIKASYAQSVQYNAGEATCTITVNPAGVAPEPVLEGYYQKVTSDSELTTGRYLIVSESNKVAFKSSLSTLDVTGNNISVTIEEGQIGETDATVENEVYIDVTDNSIKAANGKYIGRTNAKKNGLTEFDTAQPHSISISSGNATISCQGTDNTTMYLKYNADTDQKRFRYFTTSGTLQLYKYVAPVSPDNIEIYVNEAGMSTYTSNFDLDFTGLEVKAYIAKEDAGQVKYTQVNKVAKETGVLLVADGGGKFTVPTATGDIMDDTTGNLFKRGTGAAVASGSGPYNYILNVVNNVIGFYRANSQTVATNRAYMQTTINAGAGVSGREFIAIDLSDSGTTGISSTLKYTEVEGKEVYNLNGQRVAQPTKGLYIINGKKVVIK